MIEISHHGATSGVTGSCHELTLTPGMNKGSDPAGSDPRSAADSGSAGMLVKKGSDPVGSDPNFTSTQLDPTGSDPNFKHPTLYTRPG